MARYELNSLRDEGVLKQPIVLLNLKTILRGEVHLRHRDCVYRIMASR